MVVGLKLDLKTLCRLWCWNPSPWWCNGAGACAASTWETGYGINFPQQKLSSKFQLHSCFSLDFALPMMATMKKQSSKIAKQCSQLEYYFSSKISNALGTYRWWKHDSRTHHGVGTFKVNCVFVWIRRRSLTDTVHKHRRWKIWKSDGIYLTSSTSSCWTW